jgi:nucleotide-binding universal stress UspA family protein
LLSRVEWLSEEKPYEPLARRDEFVSPKHVQKSTVFHPLIDEDGIPITPWFGEEIIMLPATAPHFIPTKILVPVDFSSSSDAALETASDLAQHFHAELYLLNVIPMLPMGTKAVSFPESEYLHKAEGNAERQLATCDAALVSKGIKASSSIEIGNDVVGNIMQVIEREHIDMIVISTHGISGWRPMIFGSIAEKVVKQVQCPLLLLRSAEPTAAA